MANVHNCHELVDRKFFEFCCIKIFFNYDSIVHADRNRMAGKQAKILFDHHVHALLAYAQASRYPGRNRVIVLLSVKAGLRAGEIANLTWPMVLDPSGEIATYIELHDGAAKNRSGRRVPLHNDLREALARWREVSDGPLYVVGSETAVWPAAGSRRSFGFQRGEEAGTGSRPVRRYPTDARAGKLIRRLQRCVSRCREISPNLGDGRGQAAAV
jgi:integrase